MLPQLPRAQWESHPNFPRQTLLLGSHINFRRISRYIIDHVSASTVSELRRLYRRWMMAMRGHEAYEERKLYPFLERRWGLSFADALEGHEELHRREERVFAGFDGCLRDPSAANLAQLRVILTAYDKTLHEHLELEEDLVIPALLALSRAEFDVYYAS